MILRTVISVLLVLLIAGTAFVIIYDNGEPGRKLAWLLIIALLPALGLVLYFCFGINWRHHWFFNRRHQRYMDAFLSGTDERVNTLLFDVGRTEQLPEAYRPLALLLSSQSSLTVSGDNDFEIITEGRRKFDLLVEDLSHARESIHMEYFHFGNDAGSRVIKEILMKKAQEGVEVRFINENIANFPISSVYYDDMKKAGVQVEKFTNPRNHLVNLVTVLNYRDHRKIVVIDGKIGYTGGMNINDKYFLHWRDTHLRLTGSSVSALQFVFLDSWLMAGGTLDRPVRDYFPQPKAVSGKFVQIVPDEPLADLPVLQMSYEWAISHTRNYIWLQTPYFVPPEPVLNALLAAAIGGADVRIMLPARADNFFMRPANRLHFRELVAAGVKIYLRGGEFIHSKTLVSDDYLSSIGTANLDYRSFNINYEVNAYVYDRETALRCKAVFEEDMRLSTLVTQEWVDNLKWYHRFAEGLVGLFATIL